MRFKAGNVDITQNAFAFAMIKHFGQKRKYGGDDYIVHPIMVAGIVNSHGGDKHMVAAAFLHDVLEDTDATADQLVHYFGADVANLVIELTDVFVKPEHGNRKQRKELERARLSEISARAQTIKLADIIDNTNDIVEHDKDFAKVYLAEIAATLEVLNKGNPELLEHAKSQVEKANDQAKRD